MEKKKKKATLPRSDARVYTVEARTSTEAFAVAWKRDRRRDFRGRVVTMVRPGFWRVSLT